METKIMKTKLPLFSILILCLLVTNCTKTNSNNISTLINTSHLDNLYEEIKISGNSAGIVHIYSEYPDYRWVGDDDEGIACVDDAARALVFYLKQYQVQKNIEYLNKVKGIIEFLLLMQSENGYFYNFIFEDYSINKTHENSVPEAKWWSWRAIWALSESYKFYSDYDAEYAKKLWPPFEKGINSLRSSLTNTNQIQIIEGFETPTWLPFETASDQAALQILCLTNYYNKTKDIEVLKSINHLGDGILIMQANEGSNFPGGTLLSWKNIWHGWGNLQSYALLKSYNIMSDPKVAEGALNEINSFYRYLIKEKYLSEIIFKKVEDETIISDSNQFPQIAYIIRPMVFACLEAFEITNDSSYAELAGNIACWLLGDNISNIPMYNPTTGMVYDGIVSPEKTNLNSGAESTIEGLLTIQAIENNSIARKIVYDYFRSNNQ
jgi:hypothetical protein